MNGGGLARHRLSYLKVYPVRPVLPSVHIVRVSSKGQIVIPQEVRKRHRLRRDTDLVLVESGEAIVLTKKADVEGILKDEFAPFVRASEEALKELWDNPEDEVWNDI